MRRVFKIVSYTVLLLLVLLIVAAVWIRWGLVTKVPEIADRSAEQWQREEIDSSFYRVKNCWLRHSESGLWEEYLEGSAFERGVAEGKLCKELQYVQEEAFADQILAMVPNHKYLHVLGYLTKIFNRHLQDNITPEYRQEIYGESLYAPHDFDYISPPYDRLLNYHAAHDLSHAMQSLALVGCTAFAAWGPRTSDSLMLIGRNFDFYAGDKFAKNKIVLFCKPDSGRKFVMITWPSFIGCTSGMNDAGLTITINSDESPMPTSSATPISLLAREILQYATTIDEAYAIARRRRIFVSESLLIGSAHDHRAAIIEKTPYKMTLYDPGQDLLLSTNHFLSDFFHNEQSNLQAERATSSGYRYEHLAELIDAMPAMNPTDCARILRDQKGKGGKDIGMCNEKAVNQLIAHHSVIFQPERSRFWVSTQPFMLGRYICYDFDSVFAEAGHFTQDHEIYNKARIIAPDTFLATAAWSDFCTYKKGETDIVSTLNEKPNLAQPIHDWDTMIRSNHQYWYPYYLVGRYYQSRQMDDRALGYYQQALTKEINDSVDVYEIKKVIQKIGRKN